MKKILFLLGGAVGFLLGSRIGRGPYEAVQGQVRRLSQRPDGESEPEGSESLSSHAAPTASPVPGSTPTSTPSADTIR